MASLSPYSITLGATDYPVKYSGLLSYIEPYLTNLENFSFPGSGNVTLAGTFSATKLIPTGGTATGNGMYLPAANTLAWSNNGAETMRLDSSGNLGIGGTPEAKLDIFGLARAGGNATYRGDVTIRQAGNALAGNGGLEFKPDGAGSGYGARIQSTFNGVSAYDLSFQLRNNSASWTQYMLLDTAGNLGIGTSSPSSKLHVVGDQLIIAGGTGTSQLGIQVKGTALTAIPAAQVQGYIATGDSALGVAGDLLIAPRTDVATSVRFITGTTPAERMRLDSSGNLLVGTTSAAGRLTVEGSQAAAGTLNALTLRNSSDGGVGLYFDNSTSNNLASIEALVTSTGAGSDDGILAFSTATNGTNTERARIDSSGYLLIGYTASNGAYRLQVNSQIYATNATIATSDGRYKEDVRPLAGALDLVQRLRPVTFKWQEHPVHDFPVGETDVGFIAQEAQQALDNAPYASQVVKGNSCTLPDGEKEEFLGIADGKLIAVLTAAIQEQQALINDLRARVAALEQA